MSSDSETSDVEVEHAVQREEVAKTYDDASIKVRKPRSDKGVKKERTPAQKEAIQKALTVLKERREAKARDEKERLQKASEAEKQRILAEKYEKQKQQKKKLPPAPSYVTLGDFENFKKELLGAMPKEVYKAVEVEKKPRKVEAPVQPVVREVVKERMEEKPKVLTGSALLDEILFRNR
jgi:hypothetical protein